VEVDVKYDPMGNRVFKKVNTTTRKYIVDITGKLPTILCEVDTSDSSLTKSYIYSDSAQILAQRDGGQTADEYFYITDRLGSVRQLISYDSGTEATTVQRNYTYSPFGQTLETAGSFANNFMSTGQWYDSLPGLYYLRARMYDPYLMRFTTRDPVFSEQEFPLTQHKYLYCINDPVNRVDPSGKISMALAKHIAGGLLVGAAVYSETINMAVYAVDTGNDKFFSMALVTLGVNPAIAGMGFMEGAGVPNAVNAIISKALEDTLYAVMGGYRMTDAASLAMTPLAYFMFQWTIGMSRQRYDIHGDEMNEFNEWNNPSSNYQMAGY